MKFTAQVKIMPLAELLDPQGKAITGSLHNLGLGSIDHVRVGKNISLNVEAASKEEAMVLVEKACTQLLANAVMESFEISISDNA